MLWLELSEAQKRQYIDAESVYRAYQQAKKEAWLVRGSMFWRAVNQTNYLIKASPAGAQKSMGPQTPEKIAVHDRFNARKAVVEARLASLKTALAEQQRVNAALRVGRTPNVVVDILNRLEDARLDDHFLTVGTHALFAYETACGVRVPSDVTATQDMDLLFDTQKRISLYSQVKKLDTSLLGILKKADKSFTIRSDQKYTAVNDKGFEVDIIRRKARGDGSHPLKMSDSDAEEEDFWAVQVDKGAAMISSERFEQVVVSVSGAMATMKTIHPLDFARIKSSLATLPNREPLKKNKDARQAELVNELVPQYLPHLMRRAKE